jgi:hypothetical protein
MAPRLHCEWWGDGGAMKQDVDTGARRKKRNEFHISQGMCECVHLDCVEDSLFLMKNVELMHD